MVRKDTVLVLVDKVVYCLDRLEEVEVEVEVVEVVEVEVEELVVVVVELVGLVGFHFRYFVDYYRSY
jgi:hypothetical protein